MNKKSVFTLIVIAIILAIVGGIVWGSRRAKPPVSSDEIVLYYGDTCPHCKDVEAFIDENGLKSKLTIIEKEVYNNAGNAAQLQQVARECDIPANQIYVPFLYAEKKCFIGVPDIERYLLQKVNPEASQSANTTVQ